MFKSILQDEKIHGLIFDGAMFLGNFAFALLGIYDMGNSGSIFKGNVWIFIAFLVGGFTTFLVRSPERRKESDFSAKIGPKWLEFVADGLLWVSISMVTRIFWDGLVLLIEPASGVGINGQGIVLLVAMSFLYVFFIFRVVICF